MMIGITIIANLMQMSVHILFVKLFLLIFPKNRPLKIVIEKNIIAHNSRNSKTALVFSISMAFLIFISAGFRLQKSAINDLFAELVGSDIKMQTIFNSDIYLDEYGLTQYLESYK